MRRNRTSVVRNRQRGTVSCYIKDVLLSMVRCACISGFTMRVQSACTHRGSLSRSSNSKTGWEKKTKFNSKFYTKQVLGVSMIFQITGNFNCFRLCERRRKQLLNLSCNMEKKHKSLFNSRDTRCSCFCWIAAGTLTNIVLTNDV